MALVSTKGNVSTTASGVSSFYTYIEINKTKEDSDGIYINVTRYLYVQSGNYSGTYMDTNWKGTIVVNGIGTYGKEVSEEVLVKYGNTVSYSAKASYTSTSGKVYSSSAPVTYTAPSSAGESSGTSSETTGGGSSSSETSGTTTVPSYTIIFNSNDDATTGSMASQVKTQGQSITLRQNGYALEGCQFDHWNTAADGSGTSYSNGATYSIDADAIFYAIWKPEAPTISADGYRVESSGDTSELNTGSYMYVKITYEYAIEPSAAKREIYVNGTVVKTIESDNSDFGIYEVWLDGYPPENEGTIEVYIVDSVCGETTHKSFSYDKFATYKYTFQLDHANKEVQTPGTFVSFNQEGFGFTAHDENAKHKVSFGVKDGVAGIYDEINAKWLIRYDLNSQQAILNVSDDDAESGGESEDDVVTHLGPYMPSGVSVSSGEWVLVGQMDFPAGNWMALFNSCFSANGTGVRRMCINTNESGVTAINRRVIASPGNSTCQANTTLTCPIVVTEYTTYYMWVWQNSGSDVTVYPDIEALRIS